MGLDDFATSGGSTSTSSNSSSKKKSSEFPKTIWNGKRTLAEGHKKRKLDKEEWEAVTDYIQEHFNIDEDELMELKHERRYHLVANTHKKLFFDISEEDECFVCGHEFTFPDENEKLEYNGGVCCASHTMREVSEAEEEETDNGT